MKTVRNSAKAIIIRDNSLLVIRNTTDGHDWYLLPGGGQEHGETLVNALRRECLEEASIEIEVGDIIFIRDYISRNHEFADTDNDAHQVEFMFKCSISGDKKPETGSNSDQWQTGVQWLPLKTLSEFDLYPSGLKEALSAGIPEEHNIYLGDVN
ncbi:MAG: NUDIX domain-containing protein [Candidatus Sabulitectum sp.]|nr:NUDIX domain-containing protein [Candidatus Sabulitectum sp.]